MNKITFSYIALILAGLSTMIFLTGCVVGFCGIGFAGIYILVSVPILALGIPFSILGKVFNHDRMTTISLVLNVINLILVALVICAVMMS